MGNPPYCPSIILINVLHSSRRVEITHICSAPFLGKHSLGVFIANTLLYVNLPPNTHNTKKRVSLLSFYSRETEAQ